MAQPPAPRSSPLALTVLALLHYQPLHPYGIQRLIKQWGKDQVVNVEQRTSLYRTIERLLAAGLIAVRETGRDPRYPERTVYEVTEAGRQWRTPPCPALGARAAGPATTPTWCRAPAPADPRCWPGTTRGRSRRPRATSRAGRRTCGATTSCCRSARPAGW